MWTGPIQCGKGTGKGLKYSSATKALTRTPPPPKDAQWTIIPKTLPSLSVVVHGTWWLGYMYTKITSKPMLTDLGRDTALQPQVQLMHNYRRWMRHGMGYPNRQRHSVSKLSVAGAGLTCVLTKSCLDNDGSVRKRPQRCNHCSYDIETSGKRCAMNDFISECNVTESSVLWVVTVGGNIPFNHPKIGS